MTAEVGRDAQHEAFADAYLRYAADSLLNAHYDRPACLDLLGDVSGKLVLDAACGPGLYAAELIRRGARVIGFDQSPRMVQISAERCRPGEFRVHDLNDRLDWLPDASADLVLCALAFGYVDNRVAALRELRRVLRPGGALVLSRAHPVSYWQRYGGSYFDVRVVEEVTQDVAVRFWKEPLEAVCADFAEAGFLIERLVEPRPVPAGAGRDPDGYDRLSQEPFFIAFRLRPVPSR
jgi:SAM-dependent methyltransferase